jgi:hypothetical protein
MGSTVGCKNLLVCAYFWEKNAPDRMYFTQPMGGGTISPTLHYPRTHYSTIPLFHHSNCERSELTCQYANGLRGYSVKT